MAILILAVTVWTDLILNSGMYYSLLSMRRCGLTLVLSSSIFDTCLHYNFKEASDQGNAYDIRAIWDGTLVKERPMDAVTLVESVLVVTLRPKLLLKFLSHSATMILNLEKL